MRLVRVGFAGVLTAALAFSASAYAAGGEGAEDSASPTSTLEFTYHLYAGGISFGKAAMTARLTGDDYKASALVETQGIVNKFWQSKIETASNGTIGERSLSPSEYNSFTTRRVGQRQEVTLKFDPDGPSALLANPPYNENQFPVSDAQKKRSLDPLSAMLYLTTSYVANQEKPCQVVAPVFDGRRRYDIAFSFEKKADVKMDNGLYSGPALVCQVLYKQVAGYQQRIVDNGHQLPKIYAWVAAFQSKTDPTRHYMVPVRLWAESDFGVIVAVMDELKLDGVEIGKPG